MISGRRPFGGDSYAATLRFVLYDDLQPLPAVPSQVSRVLEGALCKSPNGRYASTSRLLADLELARGNSRPVEETATLSKVRVPPPSRKQIRPAVALSSVLLISVLLALLWRGRAIRFIPENRSRCCHLLRLADGASTLVTDSLAAANPNAGPRLSSAPEVQNARVTNAALQWDPQQHAGATI